MNKAFAFATLTYLTTSLHSYVEHPLNEKEPIEVQLSHNSHNRIEIGEGGIAKTFGDSSTFSINLDSTTGQAFINLNQKIETTPKTITIVTNSGYVQDLLITSKEGGGEHIRINEQLDQDDDDIVPNLMDFQTIAIDLLNTILSGETPIGYGKRESTPQERLNLPNPLHGRALYTLEGAFEEVVVYEILNRGKQKLHLNPETLKSPQDSWVFLTSRELSPKNGKTCCIISKPKEGHHD